MSATRLLLTLTLVVMTAPATAQQAAPDDRLAAPTGQDPLATRRLRLESDTLIDGIHCAATGREYAEFFVAGGRLAECPLARDADIAGHTLPAGTWIIRHPDGRLRMAWLSRDTRIGRITCKGTGYKEWVTTFHGDGSLATCYLPETTTIDGVTCRRATIWGEFTGGVTVRFHPDGRLASCRG